MEPKLTCLSVLGFSTKMVPSVVRLSDIVNKPPGMPPGVSLKFEADTTPDTNSGGLEILFVATVSSDMEPSYTDMKCTYIAFAILCHLNQYITQPNSKCFSPIAI